MNQEEYTHQEARTHQEGLSKHLPIQLCAFKPRVYFIFIYFGLILPLDSSKILLPTHPIS